MARQLVKSGVDTGKMAMAGMVQNYEGEALAAVGAIIGEAFDTATKNESEVDKQLEEEKTILGQAVGEGMGEPGAYLDNPVEEELLEIEEVEEEEFDDDEEDVPPVIDTKPQVYSLDMFQADFEAEQIAKGVPGEEAKSLALAERAKAEGELMAKYGTLSPTAKQKKMKSGEIVNNTVLAEYDKLSNKYKPGTATPTKNSTTKGSAGVAPKRLMPGEKGSPFSRLAKVFDGGSRGRSRGRTVLSNEDTFNQLAGQTGSQLPISADQTFVAKQRYMRTPSWASGTSVAAAIEGWNIGVEADNYRNQLEADIKDSQEREWKGMVDEAKERSLEDQSLLAIFDSYKAEYANAQNLPPAEREEALRKIMGGVTQIEGAKKNFNNLQTQMKELFPNVAWNMVPEKQADEFMTVLKGGGEMGFFPGEDGEIYYMGKSRHGMPMKKKLSSLMDPEAGILNLPTKADVYGVIDQIAEGVEKDKYMTEIEGPDGMIRKQPIPIEDLQRELDFEINQAIQQYGARSLAANLPAFQGKGGYAKWQAGLGVDSDMAGNSINVLKRNMTEALHHKLSGYMAQDTVKAGEGYKSQLRRQEQLNKASLDTQVNAAKTNQDQKVSIDNRRKEASTSLANAFSTIITSPGENKKTGEKYEGTVMSYNKKLEAMFTGAKNIGKVVYDPTSQNLLIYGKQTQTSSTSGDQETKKSQSDVTLDEISFGDKTVLEKSQIISNLLRKYDVDPNPVSTLTAAEAIRIADATLRETK